MIRGLRENLALKLIALATAIMIWSYAATERVGAPTRQVIAEVVPTGQPPDGLTVDLGAETVTVEIAGPRAQLDSVVRGAIKAIVDLSAARPGARTLRVTRFVSPPEAAGITFPGQVRTVPARIETTARKRMQITVQYRTEPPLGKRFTTPRIEPGWADVEGARDSVESIASIVVRPDVKPQGFGGQVPIDAVDRNGLAVDAVRIDPPTAYVEIQARNLAEVRTLIVSPTLVGRPAPPFVVSAVSCDPVQVEVTGPVAELIALRALRTHPINVDGIAADTTRQVALDLPGSVQPVRGAVLVNVTVRLRDASRPEP